MEPEWIAAVAGAVVALAGLVFNERRERRKLRRQVTDERTEQLNEWRRQVDANREDAFREQKAIAASHAEDAKHARTELAEAREHVRKCESDVAELRGTINEVRARLEENERTFAELEKRHRFELEQHRGIKHAAISALTVSEGILGLVQQVTPKCECGTLAAIEQMMADWRPRYEELISENALDAETWHDRHSHQREGAST